jgi:hypothetical protein
LESGGEDMRSKTILLEIKLDDVNFRWTKYHTRLLKEHLVASTNNYICNNLELTNSVEVISNGYHFEKGRIER